MCILEKLGASMSKLVKKWSQQWWESGKIRRGGEEDEGDCTPFHRRFMDCTGGENDYDRRLGL